MANVVTDLITKVRDGGNPVVTTVSSSRSPAGASLACDNLAHWPNETVHFMTYRKTANGAIDKATQLEFKGIVSGNTIGSVTLKQSPTGVDLGNTIGDFVQMAPTAAWGEDLYNALIAEHKVTGKHSAITADSITATAGTFDSITINGSGSTVGWSPLGATPSTITNNGNHSTDLTFTGVDLTSTLSEGMRVRTARTVAAPIQCATFDGTNDYFSKSSPAGMTFTDDFGVNAWVKLGSYNVAGIVSCFNGTSGWDLIVGGGGILELRGFNAGGGNMTKIGTYQSIPLNKWVHIAAQLDMSSATVTGGTANYFMIDGVDVPIVRTQTGTNPASLIQAGNLEIGSTNGGAFFPGKIAQVAIYSAKVTQATIKASMNQGLTGSETSLISAYSLSNSLEDLSANNNDLTANGGVLATTADSPFGNSGASTDKEYAIVMSKPVYSGGNTTVTVQTPEGCAIPTSGGVSSVDYSSASVPFGFPRSKSKWTLLNYYNSGSKSAPTPSTWYNVLAANSSTSPGDFILPIGSWKVGYQITLGMSRPAASSANTYASLATTYNGSPGSAEMARRFEVVTRSTAVGASSIEYEAPVTKEDNMTVSVATPLHMIVTNETGGNNLYISGYPKIYAENAYL